MTHSFRKIAGVALCCAALASPGTPIGPPSFENEQLRYNVNWPSGLSLGEAQLGSSRDKALPM
jgi:hypothetical protein